MSQPSAPLLHSDQTVVIVTTFDHPREQVFDAWVRPELLAQWFAPVGQTFHVEHMDVRPGGTFHWCIRNPSFSCWTIGTYLEVERPERLVYSWSIADASGAAARPASQGHDPEWPQESIVRVTFEEEGRSGDLRVQTVVTLEQNVSEALAKKTGAYPSWLQMLAALERMLAALEAKWRDP
jgi:uncharacterized protein YndB with AHSA1/START domain